MADKKYIALTFDDGPSDHTSRKVLDILKKYNVIGSFFLIGENIPGREDIVREELSYGCDIENHSLTHPFMTKLTADEIDAEIKETTRRIVDITGKEPDFFRPPYIDVNDLMHETVPYIFISGYGCLDWEPEVGADERLKGILEGARDGAVVLLHDSEGNDATVEALDRAIPELLQQGYEFVTISELFKKAGIDRANAKKGTVYSYTDD